MDIIIDVRAWFTVVMMVTFISIVVWAWSKKRSKDFHEAAHLPLNEPETPRPLDDSREDKWAGEWGGKQ
ncbi:MAG: cbb3-type cytochrome c oxidase subunit 3 [Thioalkalispiraceae bacterium]|jgi:cytochrome c oxidase cbb3-type subunit 4